MVLKPMWHHLYVTVTTYTSDSDNKYYSHEILQVFEQFFPLLSLQLCITINNSLLQREGRTGKRGAHLHEKTFPVHSIKCR